MTTILSLNNLLQAVLSRRDAKVNKTKDTEGPQRSKVDLQELKQTLQRNRNSSK